MQWFRLYNEVYRDPKVRTMRPELFKFWINFMCVASESEPRGTVESEMHLSLRLGVAKGLVKRWVHELEALHLLDRSECGGLTPNSWAKRQPDWDDPSKRKKPSKAKVSVKNDREQNLDASRNTARERHGEVTLRVRRDLDIERDREDISPLSPLLAENDEPVHSPDDGCPKGNPPTRIGDDQRYWERALTLLKATPRTLGLGQQLEMHADVPSVHGLKAWRFVHAAEQVQIPGRPNGWGYFMRIATNATVEDFQSSRPTAGQSAKSEPVNLYPEFKADPNSPWHQIARESAPSAN